MWWDDVFLRRVNGRLYLGRVPAAELAQRFGTPLFVYSRPRILANYERLRRVFGGASRLETRIYYAMKANPNQDILRLLRRRGAWLDAVSPGEVEAARRAGFAARRILFTGTSTGAEDIRRVFAVEGITFNIDAMEQLELMREVRRAARPRRRILVSVRCNPGIGGGFNPKVITAGARSSDGTPIKFGIEVAKVPAVFVKALEYGFEPVGLHQHLGSGWTRGDFPVVCEAVNRLTGLAARLEDGGFSLDFLDFGGGFGPRYYPNQGLFPVEKYAAHVGRAVANAGISVRSIAVEPGKYLVADAGVLLLRVEYVKESFGQRFVCVNSGTFNSLPRPAVYAQARHEVLNCERLKSRRLVRVTVAGNLCETGDVFGKDVSLPEPARGDILAVLHAGAYARSMASNFNLREIPGEVLI
jgi:diaminopimelate decarboxylase